MEVRGCLLPLGGGHTPPLWHLHLAVVQASPVPWKLRGRARRVTSPPVVIARHSLPRDSHGDPGDQRHLSQSQPCMAPAPFAGRVGEVVALLQRQPGVLSDHGNLEEHLVFFLCFQLKIISPPPSKREKKDLCVCVLQPRMLRPQGSPPSTSENDGPNKSPNSSTRYEELLKFNNKKMNNLT